MLVICRCFLLLLLFCTFKFLQKKRVKRQMTSKEIYKMMLFLWIMYVGHWKIVHIDLFRRYGLQYHTSDLHFDLHQKAVEAQMAVIQTWSRAMWHTAVIRRFNLSSLKLKWVTHIILLFPYSSTHLVCLRMKTGSKPETDIPTSGDSGSSSLPLCTEPIKL